MHLTISPIKRINQSSPHNQSYVSQSNSHRLSGRFMVWTWQIPMTDRTPPPPSTHEKRNMQQPAPRPSPTITQFSSQTKETRTKSAPLALNLDAAHQQRDLARSPSPSRAAWHPSARSPQQGGDATEHPGPCHISVSPGRGIANARSLLTPDPVFPKLSLPARRLPPHLCWLE